MAGLKPLRGQLPGPLQLWIPEPIRNEFDALQYVRKHTTIRVPKPLERRETEDGYYALVCEFVEGVQLSAMGKVCHTPGSPATGSRTARRAGTRLRASGRSTTATWSVRSSRR